VLDTYPGAAAAYSLRALSSGWLAGDVVEVRRDVDGGGDVHKSFTASDYLNGVLLAWVTEFSGTANGSVSTWYDQSGNAKNATQGSANAQPKIVDAGALVTGGIYSDGVDDALISTAFLTSAPATIVSKGTHVMGSSSAGVTFADSSATDQAFGQSTNGSTNQNRSFVFNSSFAQSSSVATLGNDDFLGSSILTINGANTEAVNRLNGVAATLASNVTPTGIDRFAIGSLRRLVPDYYAGAVAEVIVYDSDQSSNIVGIEANINAYYSIY